MITHVINLDVLPFNNIMNNAIHGNSWLKYFHITWNYGQSRMNTGSCLMAMVKRTVTKLKVQNSTSLVTSYLQDSPPASQTLHST